MIGSEINDHHTSIRLNEHITTERTIENISIKFGTFNAGGLRRKLSDIMQRIVDLDLDWVWITETKWEERIRDPPCSVSNIRGQQVQFGSAHYGTMILHNPARPMAPVEFVEVGELGHFQVFRWKAALFIGLYIPPSEEVEENDQAAGLITRLLRYRRENEPCFLLGDFNMRIAEVTGDRQTNNRGRLFRNLLFEDTDLIYRKHTLGPEGQSYTFRDDGIGTSIVDYIITTDDVTEIYTRADYHNCRAQHVLLYGEYSYHINFPILEPRKTNSWKIHKLRDKEVREQMQENFKDIFAPYLMELLDQFVITNQADCDELDEEITNAFKKNADQTIGRARGFTGRLPKSSKRLEEINEVHRMISRRIDAFRGRGIPDELNELRSLIIQARQDAAAEADRLIQHGFQEYVDELDLSESHEIMKILCGAKRSRLRRKTCLLGSSNDKVEEYCQFFAGQFSRPRDAIDWPNVEIVHPPHGDKEWVSKDEVREVIAHLASGKAGGRSGLRNELVKHTSRSSAEVLAKYFNMLINTGFIPSAWRKAMIVPIPKKPRSSEISDYRPISLTEILRKIFERCILGQIVGKIEPLDLAQGGFRRHRGTIEVIAAYNESIIQFQKRNRGTSPIVLFIDIKAAYDSVDHNILLTKLKQTGIDEYLLRTVQQLMVGISSRLLVNGLESREFLHEAGVLQGSIISPMLYSLYINDLARSVREIVPGQQSIFMYADDVAILIENSEQLQELIPHIVEHSIANNYRFNPRKCEIMNTSSEVHIYNIEIPHCTTFKYLGVMVDSKGIRWDLHLERLEQKTDQMLQFFRSIGFNSKGFRERTRVTLFKTFLRPLWEYCLCIMPNIKKYMDRLTRLQHKCLTAMFSIGPKASMKAVQLLCGVPDVRFRWTELTARWHVRLREKDEQHMVIVAKNSSRNFLKTRSAFASIGSNEIVQHYDQSEDRKKKLTDSILAKRAEKLESLKAQVPLMRKFMVDADCKPRGLYNLSRKPRKTARICALWMLGRIPGKPRKCHVCGDELIHSYNHYIDCTASSQIHDLIEQRRWFAAEALIRRMIQRMEGLEMMLESG
jgi:hypothetical protein